MTAHALSAFNCADMQVELALARERIVNLEQQLAAAIEDKKYGWETAREASKVYDIEHKLLLAAQERNLELKGELSEERESHTQPPEP